jgi:hypothetical protein
MTWGSRLAVTSGDRVTVPAVAAGRAVVVEPVGRVIMISIEGAAQR